MDVQMEPVEMTDKNGASVTIRLAVENDHGAVASHIADHTGTGSGTGGDGFLVQEFKKNVADLSYTVLFAETTAEKIGLGMVTLAWSSPTESHWQGLRVSQEARGRGIANLMFKFAAQLCIKHQGPKSTAYWGVVSNNEIMTSWSQRLKLHGPTVFRRHGAKVSTEAVDTAGLNTGKSGDATGSTAVELPAGYVLRAAGEADIPIIMKSIETFEICKSEFGTQNFLRIGWGKFSELELTKAVMGEPLKGEMPPLPQLILDSSGSIVALATLGRLKFGEMKIMMHKYMDGTKEGLKLMLESLPGIAKEDGCHQVGGYVPTHDLVLGLIEENKSFTRMTETDQWEYHWLNGDYR